MKKKYLESVNVHNSFNWIADTTDFTPEEIKAFIVEVLTPYIDDSEKLQAGATGVLAVEAANIAKILAVPEWKELFEEVIQNYRIAKSSNAELLYHTIATWEREIDAIDSNFTMQVLFETDTNELSLDEFRFELFRNIGALIEATLQTYLREYLCVLLIAKNCESIDFAKSATLGQVVSEIESRGCNKSLVCPSPWGLRLSQWRNIAQHFDSYTEGEYIVCKYGSRRQNTIKLSREELLQVGQESVRRLSILKASKEIFIYNNYDELIKYAKPKEPDTDTKLFYLSVSFSSQGFKTVDLAINDKCVTFAFCDMKPYIGTNREAHCAQFLIAIFNYFPNRNVSVIYRNPDLNQETVYFATKRDLKKVLKAKDTWHTFSKVLRTSRRPAEVKL